jgi:hypothetical protein
VKNVPPSVSIDSMVQPNPDFILPEDLLEFTGSYTDPGLMDTCTIEWNFGDGTPVVMGTLTASHAYTLAGEYSVTLTVTDKDLGVGSDSMTIVTSTPAVATEMVIEDIIDMGLEDGTELSLRSKLSNAIDLMDRDKEKTAANVLNAFMNHVEAQRNKKLSEEQADVLIGTTEKILKLLLYA